MTDKEQPLRPFLIERVTANNVVIFDMEPVEPGKTAGHTRFRILQSGAEPMVDIEYTELGRVEGPAMKFVGCIAMDKSVEVDPESIVEGQVLAGHSIVVEDPVSSKKVRIPGKVANKEPKIYYRRRKPNRNT